MKYKNIAYALLLSSGSLMCSEGIENKKIHTSSDVQLNVEIGRQLLDKLSPGAPWFQQNNIKYSFCEWMMLGTVSVMWFMALYSIPMSSKK